MGMYQTLIHINLPLESLYQLKKPSGRLKDISIDRERQREVTELYYDMMMETIDTIEYVFNVTN
jgi:hypothetical protein